MTWFNQFLPSLGSYDGIVKFGVGLRVCRRLIISGETCDTCGVGIMLAPMEKHMEAMDVDLT